MKEKPVNKIKITCDSTCDLAAELYEKYDVEVLPLGINLGDVMYTDGVDVTAEKVFEFVAEKGVLPKTSAVSIAEYESVLKKYVDLGYSVIHINISSEFSSCHQNALVAASEIGNLYPIDSRHLSAGSGHLVIAAAEMAAAGMEANAIAEALTDMQKRLDVSFVLQTLDYLKKGGRCSGVVALAAGVLQLRPEIEVVEGKMKVGRKYRGKAEKSILD